jgi:hypothetical protein
MGGIIMGRSWGGKARRASELGELGVFPYGALGIIFMHSNGAHPSGLLGALINLQPAPAESFAAPINYAQNKPLVTELTSDLRVKLVFGWGRP